MMTRRTSRPWSCAIAALGLVAAPLAAQAPVDSAATVAALRDYLDTCPVSARRPWNTPLCGPLLLVHAPSSLALATDSPPIGRFARSGRLWVGQTEPGFGVANTATELGGRMFATVNLPLPADRFTRTVLLAHEEFHRIQPSLQLNAPDRINAHLDERDGRYLLRLELRALAEALSAQGRPSESALRDAMVFRLRRYQLYPGADTLEAALETQEGLAEYTGTWVALQQGGGDIAPVLRAMKQFEQRPSYVRALGYGTGPALGLLLDRRSPGWQQRSLTGGPANLLLASLPSAPSGDLGTAVATAAGRYGGAELAVEEDARAAQRQQLRAEYRKRLVDGPVLVLEGTPNLFRSFNPNTLLPLGQAGTVYPTGSFTADWGELVIERNGALLDPSNLRVQVGLSATVDPASRAVEGDGWRLTLQPGWRLAPSGRSGDWKVVRAK